MKKIQLIILILAALPFLFSGCAAVAETEPAAVIDHIGHLDKAKAYIYDEDTTMQFVPDDAFLSLLDGTWTEKSGKSGGEKVVSIMVEAQYEICFFTDGTAMIYYGNVGILERDRQYYSFSPIENIEKIKQYIEDNGFIFEETTSDHINDKGEET